MKEIFEGALQKIFKKKERKIDIELINYTSIDIEMSTNIKDDNSMQIILTDKKDREIVENKK